MKTALAFRGRDPLVSPYPLHQSVFMNAYGGGLYVVAAAFCFRYALNRRRQPGGEGPGRKP